MNCNTQSKLIINKIENMVNKEDVVNIDLLICKHLLSSISTMDDKMLFKAFLISKIERYLINYKNVKIKVKSKDLTGFNKLIISNIYEEFGFDKCINHSFIKKYYDHYGYNYDLFLNQNNIVKDDIRNIEVNNYSGISLELRLPDKYISILQKSSISNSFRKISL